MRPHDRIRRMIHRRQNRIGGNLAQVGRPSGKNTSVRQHGSNRHILRKRHRFSVQHFQFRQNSAVVVLHRDAMVRNEDRLDLARSRHFLIIRSCPSGEFIPLLIRQNGKIGISHRFTGLDIEGLVNRSIAIEEVDRIRETIVKIDRINRPAIVDGGKNRFVDRFGAIRFEGPVSEVVTVPCRSFRNRYSRSRLDFATAPYHRATVEIVEGNGMVRYGSPYALNHPFHIAAGIGKGNPQRSHTDRPRRLALIDDHGIAFQKIAAIRRKVCCSIAILCDRYRLCAQRCEGDTIVRNRQV